MKTIKELWNRIPKKGRDEIISALHTFLSLYIAELALNPLFNSVLKLDLPTANDLKTALYAVYITATRSGWKTIVTVIVKRIFKK